MRLNSKMSTFITHLTDKSNQMQKEVYAYCGCRCCMLFRLVCLCSVDVHLCASVILYGLAGIILNTLSCYRFYIENLVSKERFTYQGCKGCNSKKMFEFWTYKIPGNIFMGKKNQEKGKNRL